MRNHEIKFKERNNNYSIIIGNNVLSLLPSKIKLLCPKSKKIALIIDKKVPSKFHNKLKQILRRYEISIFYFTANEKNKSIKTANFYLEKLLKNNFNRSDLIIGMGGGITGDFTGFVASIFKRGINFINIPCLLYTSPSPRDDR